MNEITIQNQNQLCCCSARKDGQDIEKIEGLSYRMQIRRKEIVLHLLDECDSHCHIDVGCAEGFVTTAIEEIVECVIGFDVNGGDIKKAKDSASKAEFCIASITDLPVLDNVADSITLLEVIEHLPLNIIKRGIREIDRALKVHGCLILSVPFKENISFESCSLCGKLKPTNDARHLHSFTESKLKSMVPRNYHLDFAIISPNVPLITCSKISMKIPLNIWLPINNIAGYGRKGIWLFAKFTKN